MTTEGPDASEIPEGYPRFARVAAKVELVDIKLSEARLDIADDPFSGDVEIDVRIKTGFEFDGTSLRALIGVWLRLVPANGEDGDLADEEDLSVLSIIADHIASYELPEGFEPPDDELSAFVEQVAMLAVWPYAREVIQSLAGKAGFPQVTLPIQKVSLPSAD